jgi:hypothetical protein
MLQTRHDYCVCYPGWMGNSCADRTCERGEPSFWFPLTFFFRHLVLT